MNKRLLKDLLYEQVARIGRAASSPKRLELLELLAQGEKTVEMLASELSADIKLTSAHLRVLKEARLVTFRREGKYIIYQLAGSDVAGLWVSLRQVAEEHLLELKMALGQMVADPAKLSAVSREVLLEQARRGEVFVGWSAATPRGGDRVGRQTRVAVPRRTDDGPRSAIAAAALGGRAHVPCGWWHRRVDHALHG